MNVEQIHVTVRDLCEGYYNDEEEGVRGYAERLDIRPRYQREFVYDDKQRNEVIRSVLASLPLNVMYWCRVHDGEVDYEVLDGQQRTISLCEYVDGSFSVDDMYFYNQPENIQAEILDYELFIYVCDGTDSERLKWFKIINIAGEKLSDQELRNATYAGPWVSDAKRYFSKTGGPVVALAGDYVKGTPIRQEVLETAIKWAADADGCPSIEAYMSQHQFDHSAQPLWSYFRSVIEWVQAVFPHYRKEMKGVDWGLLYNRNGERDLDPVALEARISMLMEDTDVTKKAGIYEYLLTGDENKLNIRAFDERQKREAYERQNGICPRCGKEFEIGKMQADHIKPWSKGGPTTSENCQMLCENCNRIKSDV